MRYIWTDEYLNNSANSMNYMAFKIKSTVEKYAWGNR